MNKEELIAAIKETQPKEYITCFSDKQYFSEYGFKSSQFGYKWIWRVDRLEKEDEQELMRLLDLSRG